MNFQNLKYWREKASHYSPETRLFINGEYCAAADNETFITLDPAGQRPLAKVARGKKRMWTAQSPQPVPSLNAETGRKHHPQSAKRYCTNSPI